MTQEQVTQIINTHYSDKIQMATLTETDLNCLLFKTLPTDLRQFKGYSVPITDIPFETEGDVRNIFDTVVSDNESWYSA